jgi:hypothetical protein
MYAQGSVMGFLLIARPQWPPVIVNVCAGVCYGLSVDCAPTMATSYRKCMRRGPEGTCIDCGRWSLVLCDGFACYNPSQEGVRGSHHTQKYVICLPLVSALSCIVLAYKM